MHPSVITIFFWFQTARFVAQFYCHRAKENLAQIGIPLHTLETPDTGTRRSHTHKHKHKHACISYGTHNVYRYI